MQRFTVVPIFALVLAACGGSTSPTRDRFNFAVVSGQNQSVRAQSSAPEKVIVSMVTRDPHGTFASRVMDFISPAIAYAQDALTIPGEPLPDVIVCGQQAKQDEPEIVPLCAFTLADGRAANKVVGHSKAGTYVLRFTAQVASQEPVKDSTIFTVLPGGVAQLGLTTFGPVSVSGSLDLQQIIMSAKDKDGNVIYVQGSTHGTEGTPSFVPAFAVREGDTSPNARWSDSGLPRPVTTDGWVVPLSNWTGKRVTIFFWVDDAEAHVTADVK